ncbi:TPA: hypothetical protein U5D21_002775 [Yersinia enterocolitica]|nr:hypothetical protein [Yersinia enterocolitica]
MSDLLILNHQGLGLLDHNLDPTQHQHNVQRTYQGGKQVERLCMRVPLFSFSN